jgi:hypothetical protein
MRRRSRAKIRPSLKTASASSRINGHSEPPTDDARS